MDVKEIVTRAAKVAGSQHALALELGEHPVNLSHWKSGAKPCPIEKRAAMAAIAGIDVHRVLEDAVLQSTEGTKTGAILTWRLTGKGDPPQCSVLSTALGRMARHIRDLTRLPSTSRRHHAHG